MGSGEHRVKLRKNGVYGKQQAPSEQQKAFDRKLANQGGLRTMDFVSAYPASLLHKESLQREEREALERVKRLHQKQTDETLERIRLLVETVLAEIRIDASVRGNQSRSHAKDRARKLLTAIKAEIQSGMLSSTSLGLVEQRLLALRPGARKS